MPLNKKKGKDVELQPLSKEKQNQSSDDVIIEISKNKSTKKFEIFHKKENKSSEIGSPKNAIGSKSQREENGPSLRFLHAVKNKKWVSVKQELNAGVDVNSAFGDTQFTALHYAVSVDDLKTVEILLEHKANPHAADSIGRTPFLIAAAMGRCQCLSAMLRKKANPNAVVNAKAYEGNFRSSTSDGLLSSMEGKIKIPAFVWNGSTALHEASRSNSLECVKILLDAGAMAEFKDELGVCPLLLAGAGLLPSQTDAVKCYEKVVQLLVEKGADGNANSDGMATSALLNAVFLESTTALKYLMDAKADPGWCNTNGGCTTAIHEAAGNGSVEMLRILITHNMDIKRQRELVNIQDAIQRTPLHKAAYAGSHDSVCFLLECGANLSIRTRTGSGAGISALEAIMMHIPNSKAFLNSVLDSCVTCNTYAIENRNFALWLNFSLLAPDICPRQTAVLNALFSANSISKENKRALLHHPLVEAFVRFKWFELRKYFTVVVFVYTLFVIDLSAYVTLDYKYQKNMAFPNNWIQMYVKILRYSTLFFASIALVIVIGQCAIHFQYYLRQLETWTSGLASVLSIIWCIAREPLFVKNSMTPSWAHHIISICLPISWAGLMLLLGRFPMWGSRALLFGVVLKNVVWTFLVVGCMLIGFSFSFFVQFHEVNPDAFGNPWKSFFHTIVMMTGEYEYLNLFAEKQATLPVTSRLLFFIFIVVASIVLINIIVGLAVTDTQSMNLESETRSLYKRAEFVDLLESMVAPIAKYSALNKRVKIKIHGIPRDKNRTRLRILPDNVLDSLTKIALKQWSGKENATKRNANSYTFQFLNNRTRALEDQISEIIQRFSKEILDAVKDGDNKIGTDNRALFSQKSYSIQRDG